MSILNVLILAGFSVWVVAMYAGITATIVERQNAQRRCEYEAKWGKGGSDA